MTLTHLLVLLIVGALAGLIGGKGVLDRRLRSFVSTLQSLMFQRSGSIPSISFPANHSYCGSVTKRVQKSLSQSRARKTGANWRSSVALGIDDVLSAAERHGGRDTFLVRQSASGERQDVLDASACKCPTSRKRRTNFGNVTVADSNAAPSVVRASAAALNAARAVRNRA